MARREVRVRIPRGREPRLRDQLTGTWIYDDTFEVTLAADLRYVLTSRSPSMAVTSWGTWEVRNGSLVYTITNCIAQGTPNFEAAGFSFPTNFDAVGISIPVRIVRADRSNLLWSSGGHTMSLKRKR